MDSKDKKHIIIALISTVALTFVGKIILIAILSLKYITKNRKH
jgi:uncharacterized membrane protein YqhA